MRQPNDSKPGGFKQGGTERAVAGVVAAFALLAAIVALFGAGNFRVNADQDTFHVPTVRQFQQQWPRPDLRDYPVATAPGYHLLMAAVATYGNADVRVLRGVGAIFGVLLIGLAAWGARWRSAWLALPLAASFYVLTSTVWLLPENAAWLLVTAGLLLALHGHGPQFYIASAIVLALLVFVRQSHAWMIGVFVVAALTREDGGGRLHGRLTPRPLLAALFATLPALGVLAWLVSMWRGLSPPSFQPGVESGLREAFPVGGFAPGAPGMTLAVLGGFGVPLLAWLWPATRGRIALAVPLVGGLIGFVVGVLPASSYRFPDRRSGFWAVVQKLPTFYDRSPVFVLLATAGGVVAFVALWRLRARDRLIFASALLGLTAAQMATVYLWQRYYEPFVLIWLILAAAATPAEATPERKMLRRAGLATLVVAQLLATAYALRNTQ